MYCYVILIEMSEFLNIYVYKIFLKTSHVEILYIYFLSINIILSSSIQYHQYNIILISYYKCLIILQNNKLLQLL